MNRQLQRAAANWLNAKTTETRIGIAERIALWFMILFALYMIWQLFRVLDSFATLMGL